MKVDKKIFSRSSNWKFDNNVVRNFDSHISKSVPFYELSHNLVVKMSEFFLKDNSICYDLGCSTGTLLKKLYTHHKRKKLKLIGVDESKSMLKKAKNNNSNITFKYSKIENVKLKKNDMVLSLYTMQFTKPKYRQILFDKIYKSLNWGGAFILFEKIRGNDARFQDILNFSYFDFKKDNGLSPLDILNKENSLRSVMEPYTIQANMDYMKRAGFTDIMPIAQYLCFKGFLAIK